jgi:hypothetical protein
MALRSRHERRAGQFQRSSDGAVAGGTRPDAESQASVAGPRPTLGDLQHATPWVWVHCETCQHYAPFACAVVVIRWGADTSSDKLRSWRAVHPAVLI